MGISPPQAKLDVSGVGNFSTGYNTFAGDGLHIQCAGTSGNGNYAGGISFSRISSDNNTRAAGIAAVQTETDPDRVGLAFFTHDSNTTANDLAEAMRLDSTGNLLVGVTSTTLQGGNITLPNSGIVAFHDTGGNARNALQFVSGELKHGAASGGLTSQTFYTCLLYTSPSPRDGLLSRMPSSA